MSGTDMAEEDTRIPACINDIPEELHMYILSRLDGPSLMAARRTCKMWACLVDNLEKYFQIWLMCCLKEIPLFMLMEIMGYWQEVTDKKSLLKAYKELPWIFWREIYSEYSRNCAIEKTKAQVVELYYNQEHSMVTALAFQDGKLLSGHEDGSVFQWRRVSSENVDLTMLHKHQRRVTSMAITSSCADVKTLLSGKSHSLIVTGSQDYGVFVSDLTNQNSKVIEQYSKQVNSVSCLGPYVTAVANGSFLQGQNVWKVSVEDELTITSQAKYEPSSNDNNPEHAVLTEDKVYVGYSNGKVYTWKWQDGIPNKSVFKHDFKSSIKTMLVKDNCMVCLLGNGNLEVVYDSGRSKVFDVHRILERQAECLAWRGPLLALGTKGGNVFLYIVKDIESFESLDLTCSAVKLEVEGDHVNHVAIGDDGLCPLVAVATEKPFISLFRFVQ